MADLSHPKLVAVIVAAFIAVAAIWISILIARWRRITWRDQMDAQIGALSKEARDSSHWAVWKVLTTQHEDVARPSLVLVNVGRGDLVDDNALIAALADGRVQAAGLDVFDGEPNINPRLLSAPGLTMLPHVGSATVQTRTRMAQLACQGVCDVLAGRTPPNLV